MTIITNAPQGANASDLSLDPIVWASNHPDAELLAAWEAFCGYYRTIAALPQSDAIRDPYMSRLFAAVDRVNALPAHTPAGALVKAKLAFIGYEEMGAAADAVIYRKPYPAEEVAKDYRAYLLWRLIGDLERMVGEGAEHPPAAPGPAKGVSNAHTLGTEGGVLNTHPSSPDPVKGVASTDTLGHPDAGLLATFEAWKRAGIAAESLPDDVTEEDRKLYWDRVYALRDAMEEFHPQTMAGAMAMLLFGCAGSCEAFEEVIRDTQPQDPGFYEAMLWRGITALKGINAASSADAALLAAFREYQSFMRDDDGDADSRLAEAARKVMDSTPAQTLAGALVLLGHYLGDGDLGMQEMMPVLDALKATIDLVPPEVRDVVEVVVEKAEGLAGEYFQTSDSWREALAERDQLKASLAGFLGVQSLQMVMLTEALGKAWDAADEAERAGLMSRAAGQPGGEVRAKESYDEALRRINALESAVVHLPVNAVGAAVIKLVVVEPVFSNAVERLEDLARENRDWAGEARDVRDCLSALRIAVPTLIRLLGIDLHEIGLRRYMWPDHYLDTEEGKAPISTAA